MAHNRTRIEGFEIGEDTAKAGADQVVSQSGASYSLSSSTKRSGEWSLRINPTATTTAVFIQNALGDDGNPLSPNVVNAIIFRAYLYFATLPSTTCRIIGTLDASTNPEVVVTCSSAGLLALDGVSTGITISTGIWYRFEILHDQVGANRILRLNGTEIASNMTAGDKSGEIFFGDTTTSSTYDMFIDDVVIETSTDILNIDWPGEGGIYGVDLTGDGTYDTTVAPGGAGVNIPGWEVTDHPDSYLSLNRAYDIGQLALTADTLAPFLEAKISCTKETLASAGVSGTISCVQISLTIRSQGGGNATCNLIGVTPGTGEDDLLSTITPPVVSSINYESFHWLSAVMPSHLGGGTWTSAAFDAMEVGAHYSPSTDRVRVTQITIQVEAAPETVTGGNSTVLTQLEMVTGAFWETTDYSPRIRTVQITSEALGVPNEALNVIACSIRYIPWGAGTIRASYWMDYLTTQGFDLPANPILYQNVGATTATSTFEFSASTMVDEEQVYTKHFLINQSGKFFQIEFTQTGSQLMRLLALDLEVKTEGRREAYLDGGN